MYFCPWDLSLFTLSSDFVTLNLSNGDLKIKMLDLDHTFGSHLHHKVLSYYQDIYIINFHTFYTKQKNIKNKKGPFSSQSLSVRSS